jgi:hypothetical protein
MTSSITKFPFNEYPDCREWLNEHTLEISNLLEKVYNEETEDLVYIFAYSDKKKGAHKKKCKSLMDLECLNEAGINIIANTKSIIDRLNALLDEHMNQLPKIDIAKTGRQFERDDLEQFMGVIQTTTDHHPAIPSMPKSPVSLEFPETLRGTNGFKQNTSAVLMIEYLKIAMVAMENYMQSEQDKSNSTLFSEDAWKQLLIPKQNPLYESKIQDIISRRNNLIVTMLIHDHESKLITQKNSKIDVTLRLEEIKLKYCQVTFVDRDPSNYKRDTLYISGTQNANACVIHEMDRSVLQTVLDALNELSPYMKKELNGQPLLNYLSESDFKRYSPPKGILLDNYVNNQNVKHLYHVKRNFISFDKLIIANPTNKLKDHIAILCFVQYHNINRSWVIIKDYFTNFMTALNIGLVDILYFKPIISKISTNARKELFNTGAETFINDKMLDATMLNTLKIISTISKMDGPQERTQTLKSKSNKSDASNDNVKQGFINFDVDALTNVWTKAYDDLFTRKISIKDSVVFKKCYDEFTKKKSKQIVIIQKH